MPIAAQVIVVIAFISTVIAIIGGLSLLWPGTVIDMFWKLNTTALMEFARAGKLTAGLFLLCLGVLSGIVGVGLLKGKAWAWWLALLLFVVVVGVNLARLFMGDLGELFGTPFTIGLLWLHVRPDVRQFFLS